MSYLFPFILSTHKRFEERVAQQAMEICEEVSNEMGAEVHDNLIQKLTVFMLNIDRLERSVYNAQEVESLIPKMRGDFQEMVLSVRSISRNLMPISMKGEKFTKDIEILCENLERPDQGRVHYESSGQEIELEGITQRYLHRIVQELVHNAFKHSSAWHVWVRLKWNSNELTVEVEDDGTDFHVIQDRVDFLENKFNTLKMRSLAIGAKLKYFQGSKGLLARVKLSI